MFGTVRKHSNWLWAIIITLTIISFVVFFSPQSKLDFGGPAYDLGKINGRAIGRDEYQRANREALLYFRLTSREWPTSDEQMRQMGYDLNRETYTRLLLQEKLKKMNVHVSDDATAQLVRDIFGATNGRPFPMAEYEGFLRDLQQHGLSKEDFERFVRNEAGKQHLIALFGLAGRLVTPQEADYLYRRENQSIYVEAVNFSASNYLSQVTANDTNVQHYFTQNTAQYEIPPRVQVDYVSFPVSNFLAQADEQLAKETNLNAKVEQYYTYRGGTNYFKDEKGKALSLEEARPKIKEAFRMDLARSEAEKKANQFTTALDEVKTDKEAFEKTAKTQNLNIQTSQPFDQMTGPTNITTSGSFANAAFALTPEEPFTMQPVETQNGFYVLHLKKQFAAETPKFEQVRARVVDDYKLSEARKLARRAGEKFATTLSQGLASGKKFESIVAEQKVKATALPEFTPSTRSLPELKNISLDRVQMASIRTGAGKSTDFMATEDGGVVLYVKNITPPATAKARSEMTDFSARVRDQRQYAAFSHWLNTLAEEMNFVPPATSSAKK